MLQMHISHHYDFLYKLQEKLEWINIGDFLLVPVPATKSTLAHGPVEGETRRSRVLVAACFWLPEGPWHVPALSRALPGHPDSV